MIFEVSREKNRLFNFDFLCRYLGATVVVIQQPIMDSIV